MTVVEVIIIGSSGHAKVIVDIFEKDGKYTILGFVDDFKSVGSRVLDYPILGKVQDISDLIRDNQDAQLFVAIGDNWSRQQIVSKINSTHPKVTYASAIHPSAQLASSIQIGRGVAIMAGVVVNSDSSLSDFTIINTNASLDHDCQMQQYSSLAPNASTGGNVTIGEYAAVSIGVTIKNGLTVGNHSIIGAGAVLLNNCEDNAVMYGVPAKFERKRLIGEKYL